MMNQQYTAHINNKNYTLELDANSGKINKENFELDVITENSQKAHAILKNKSYSIELVSIDEAEKKVIIKVNNNQYHVKIEDQFDHLLKSLGMDNLTANKINELKAPMPGLVVEAKVKEGDKVTKGDALMVLEAMKMENILKSPGDGIIKKINVSKGQAVEKNTVLITFE